MKIYKLKKDLPTFKAGDEFRLEKNGLWKDKGELIPIMAYSAQTLVNFPNILTDWFEEITEKPKTVWDLKEGDEFYVIGTYGDVCKNVNNSMSFTDECREWGNCFLTECKAKKELARRKAKVILERDTKGFKPIFDGNNEGYEVSYGTATKELSVDWMGCNNGTIRFATEEDAKASIKAHEKEWLCYLGVEE